MPKKTEACYEIISWKYIVIDSINLAMCRPYKDFGKGFYLTDIKEKAGNMAVRVSVYIPHTVS